MKYGLIGEHLGHSYSCEIHGAIADYEYELKELRPDELDGFMRQRSFNAINVTIPYKQSVIPYLDEISDRARSIGAVNTVVNEDGRLVGTNTDYAGVLYAFERAGRSLSDCDRVLVFGSGGASRAAVYAAQESGCKVSVLGRTPAKVEALCKDMGAEVAPGISLDGYDALINCTPVGMKDDSDYMFDLAGLKKDMAVMDMVYNRKTVLVRKAEETGCIVASGRDMLVGQGAMSFERWFGVRPDTEIMRRAIE